MNTDIQLSVTREEMQVILAALSELPLKHTMNVFVKVQQQAQACVAEQEKANAA